MQQEIKNIHKSSFLLVEISVISSKMLQNVSKNTQSWHAFSKNDIWRTPTRLPVRQAGTSRAFGGAGEAFLSWIKRESSSFGGEPSRRQRHRRLTDVLIQKTVKQWRYCPRSFTPIPTYQLGTLWTEVKISPSDRRGLSISFVSILHHCLPQIERKPSCFVSC